MSIDVEQICLYLYDSLDVYLDGTPPDLYNLSLHEDALWFGSNNKFCDYARQVYHRCYWCHQIEYEPLFCNAATFCESQATIPDDFVLPADFSDFNLSSPDGLDNCSQVYDHWAWYDPYQLSGCFRDLWLHRQCPDKFCGHRVPEQLDKNYLCATTTKEKKTLVWMSRLAAFLSFSGASYHNKCFV
jgi:hypothetical protein